MSKRKHWIEERYGVSYDDFLTVLKLQDYRCAVCGEHNAENLGKHFGIDNRTMEVMCQEHIVEDALQRWEGEGGVNV